MGHNLHIVARLTARFQYGGMCDFAGCDSKVQIKEEIAAIILFDILEEDGKRENRRGKTRGWTRRREEKGFYSNILQKLMIEDTPGYREMMRITREDFLEILMLVEPACILLQ